MPKVWRFLPHDESRVRSLCSALRVSPLTAQVLLARGYSNSDRASDFLNAKLSDLHEPGLLPGVEEAADRVVSALRARRRITIYGDYDVDGVTATALLWYCLKLAGADVDYYIPCRLEEGYGLNCDALRQFHEQDSRRLVVSVDCGICSVEEAALAKSLGLELIITDHHRFAEPLPEAACLVHPRLPGSRYPFGELCGAGVALKLAWAVCQRLNDGRKSSPRMREFLKSAVGLAAIGTIADVVPLVGENRILARYGLSSLPANSSPGMKALLAVANLGDKKQLDAEDIGFALAPRINAAGRLGQARLAVELLTTQDRHRAAQLAGYLDELNRNRRSVERRIFRHAKELVAENRHWQQAEALVLAHPDWHPGVIGIVANRLAEHFEKPAILLAVDRQSKLGQGSGRSFGNFDLHAALSGCAEHLVSFGGHRAAAGMKVRLDTLDAFRQAFCRFVAANHTVEARDREMHIDAEVRLADCTRRAVRELERLGPFGHENPRPTFAATRVELSAPPRRMGDGRHLSLPIRQHGVVLRAVAFGRGDWSDEIEATSGPISVSFAPGINRFRGRERVELQLIDWQPAG